MTYTYTEIPGWKTRLSIGGTCVEFVSCDIKEKKQIVEDDGLRGSRTRQLERVAMGQTHIGGSITMQPTPADIALILPFVFNSASPAVTLTDIMQDVTVVMDTFTELSTYVGRFSKMTLSGSPGKKIDLKLDFVGKSATFAGGGSLSTAPDVTNRPYMFSDAGATAMTINSVAYSIDKFELVVDNKITPTYMSGLLPTDLEPSDRVCTLGIQTRYTTEQTLLTLAQAGPVIASPLAGSLGFTNGTNSISFLWAAMLAQSETVAIQGRQNLRLPLNYNLYGVSTTKEMITTLV